MISPMVCPATYTSIVGSTTCTPSKPPSQPMR
jgi:hypothetical protein